MRLGEICLHWRSLKLENWMTLLLMEEEQQRPEQRSGRGGLASRPGRQRNNELRNSQHNQVTILCDLIPCGMGISGVSGEEKLEFVDVL
ncbi:hypothetical protein BVRB_9g214760 [Beta vulgaris subsp. vulgaris]|nr:hypothetical protein BVRB_9g214760 [Beta vulgaris subsp. vulgaris]